MRQEVVIGRTRLITIMGGCEIAIEVCQKVERERKENISRGAVKKRKEYCTFCLLGIFK